MAGAFVDRLVRPARRGVDRLRRPQGVRPARRLLRRAGAGIEPVLGRRRPVRFARHGLVRHDDHRAVRTAGGPARRRVCNRTAQLDARVLGRHGAGGAGQGPDRRRAAGRRAGAVHAGVARLGHLEAPAPGQGTAAVLRHRHAMVRAGGAAQSGTAALLLHPRALGPLFPEGAPPRRRVVLLHRAADPRRAAVAGRAAAKPVRRRATRRARHLPAQADDLHLGRLHLLLLQLFELQAARLHAAYLSGAGIADRRLSGTRLAPQPHAGGRTGAARRPGRHGGGADDRQGAHRHRAGKRLSGGLPELGAGRRHGRRGRRRAGVAARAPAAPRRQVLTLACAGFIATQLVLAGNEPYGKMRSGRALAHSIRAEMGEDTKLYSVGTYDQALTFYVRHTAILVDYFDEFSFGLEQQPELAIPTIDAWIDQCAEDAQNGVKDIAIIEEENYQKLQRRGVPMRVISEDPRRIVVANI